MDAGLTSDWQLIGYSGSATLAHDSDSAKHCPLTEMWLYTVFV